MACAIGFSGSSRCVCSKRATIATSARWLESRATLATHVFARFIFQNNLILAVEAETMSIAEALASVAGFDFPIERNLKYQVCAPKAVHFSSACVYVEISLLPLAAIIMYMICFDKRLA